MKLSRPFLHVALTIVLSAGVAVPAQAMSIGIAGTNGAIAIKTFLEANGHAVTNFVLAPTLDADYAGLDAFILLRTVGAPALENFVLAGGLLITEWNASSWALDTANLLSADDVDFAAKEDAVTFTAAGMAAGLGDSLPNPYSDPPRTDYYRTFANIGAGVDILATRFDGGPAILGGAAGAGSVLIIGYDWADSFPTTMSNNGQLLLNALQYRAPAPVPEPASLFLLATGAGLVARRIRRRRTMPAR